MGLDTVELLVDVEKHFDISIPNSEAEKIYTVQDFADCVFNKVSLNPSPKCQSQLLFYRFRIFFQSHLNVDRSEIYPEKIIKDLIPLDRLKETWVALEHHLNVELPILSGQDIDPQKKMEVKFFGVKVWTRKNLVTIGTLGQLVKWTLALNHKKFIDPQNLCSKRDIELIIIGIISEDLGINVDEIKLEHSITGDLGAD